MKKAKKHLAVLISFAILCSTAAHPLFANASEPEDTLYTDTINSENSRSETTPISETADESITETESVIENAMQSEETSDNTNIETMTNETENTFNESPPETTEQIYKQDLPQSSIEVTLDSDQKKATIIIENSNQNYRQILVPVWSEKNGQDDIRWYTADKISSNKWQCIVDIENHKSDSGRYNVHVYGETPNTQLEIINNTTFNISGITAGKLTCTSTDTEKGLYRLELSDAVSPAGISKVLIPVWSNNNNQSDIHWYTAANDNGKWYVNVEISNHNYHSGTFTAHAYVYDNRNMQAITGTTFHVTAMASNQLCAQLNNDQSKITLTLNNAALPVGTQYISIPVWGTANGQNDIIWYTATKINNATYQTTIPVSNHKETGTYNAHVYAVGNNQLTLISHTTFSVEPVSAKITVSNKDDINGYFTLTITDLKPADTIKNVTVPVWSQKNGQDDIKWYTAKKNGNQWTVQVDIGDHNLDTGIYNVHVYTSDSRDMNTLAAHTIVDVKAPTAKASVTSELLSDTYVKLTVHNLLGASNVAIPVWGEHDGQNDIVWYTATQINSRTWEITIPLFEHMETGKYQAHVYATINKSTELVTSHTFNISKIATNIITLTKAENSKTGTFTVEIRNAAGIPNINNVMVAVWSQTNGQDDLQWYPAAKKNNVWSVTINAGRHSYNSDYFYAHVYAYNSIGQSICLGGTGDTIEIDLKTGVEGLSDLKSQVLSIISRYTGQWGVYVKNLNTGEYMIYNNTPLASACVIKIYAMEGVFAQIAEGKLAYSPQTQSLLNSMITVSNNESFNELVRRMGDGNHYTGTQWLNDYMQSQGYINSHLAGAFQPSSTPWSYYGGRTETTVLDAGTLLERVYRGECVSLDASAKMLNLLKGQRFTEKIPAGLPAGTVTANKTGDNDVAHTDACIVYSPNCDYIICVFTNNCPNNLSGIRSISSTVYNYFN